jgi:hypothetical protein
MGPGWADRNWRAWKIENIRRSLAMLAGGQPSGLNRDVAMTLVVELQTVQARLEQLKVQLAASSTKTTTRRPPPEPGRTRPQATAASTVANPPRTAASAGTCGPASR